jgi:fructose 1,6-bisphosphate aldolase/phosphatase
MSKITVSLIKADVGGYPGHSSVHPALIETAESKLAQAKKSGALIDFRVLACGDDLELIMSHKKGCDNGEVHGLAWETFEEATEVAKKLKLYGAGQGPCLPMPSAATSGAWGPVWPRWSSRSAQPSR